MGAIAAITLVMGDCIPLMAKMKPASVDLILCDLPYGVTECGWDKCVPFDPLWKEYGRVLKENGAVLLFAQQPFSARLAARASGGLRLRYEWIWDKGAVTGFANANRMPMRRHENILVFYRHLPTYNPQGLRVCPGIRLRKHRVASEVYSRIPRATVKQKFTGYPNSIISFRRERGALPCQKPVDLLGYLIRTYSKPGEVVLDNCMGTGSTGVAAVKNNRKFIGFENDAERFSMAKARIEAAA
ncbi:MAG TPA: site-specific DNA-methyltransferase [Bryobacteraceae bacterium]|jgi:site-specific DNA-methyltransferase (adenine-specific)|nr:site-specific DNA-methyltransferase [Bryobacteraceae bacterium]